MNKSLYLGKYAGIPVKLHWTFSFIVLFVFYVVYTEHLNLNESLVFSLYLVCLFLCVVLHEYGHALAARKFGVRTRDIILSPIGGLARLERIPEKPMQEFYIAIAGPAVNMVLAIIIFTIILFSDQIVIPEEESISILLHPVGFLQMLFILNLILFSFNLIPAFPMDGGRILRALLSIKLPRLKATFIASLIGRIIAIVFIGIGAYFQHFALLFIGIFVYIMAYREYEYLKMKAHNESLLSNLQIDNILQTEIEN